MTATLAGLDTVPRTDGARVVSIVLVFCGLTIIAYAGAVIVEADRRRSLHRRPGRTAKGANHRAPATTTSSSAATGGWAAASPRSSAPRAYRTSCSTSSEEAIAAAKEHGDLLIEGDATEDEDLRRAGIDRAAGVVVASDDDADNLYISLSARNVRPDIQIVARASDEDAEKKLLLAGADRVVQPYTAAGRTMANLVLKPQVMSFLDAVTTATGPDLHMAEIEVPRDVRKCGQERFARLRVRHETGAIIVALRKRDGTFDTTPEPDAVIEPGDVIVGVGTTEELQRLEDLFARQESLAG